MTASRVLTALVVAVLAATTPAASADGELDAARRQLRELESRVGSQEREVDQYNVRLREQAGRLDSQESAFAEARRDLRRTEAELERAREEMDLHRTRLQNRARAAYMRGPMPWLSALVEARSAADVNAALVYAARSVRQDSVALADVRRAEARLAVELAAREEALAAAAAATRQLRQAHRALEREVTTQQRRLDELAAARAEARQLVESLRSRLAARDLASLERVAGRGTPISQGEWARHFLTALGAPASGNNVLLVVAWQTAEYTRATWNPLATTMPMPGATVFNSHGVRNYVSLEQGVEATIRTLRLPNRGYEPIVDALMRSADPMETAQAVNASRWCRGCNDGQYLIKVVASVTSR